MHTCHVEMVVGGDIFNLSKEMVGFASIPGNRRAVLERQPSCGGLQLHVAIYNAFLCTFCYAKEA